MKKQQNRIARTVNLIGEYISKWEDSTGEYSGNGVYSKCVINTRGSYESSYQLESRNCISYKGEVRVLGPTTNRKYNYVYT